MAHHPRFWWVRGENAGLRANIFVGGAPESFRPARNVVRYLR